MLNYKQAKIYAEFVEAITNYRREHPNGRSKITFEIRKEDFKDYRAAQIEFNKTEGLLNKIAISRTYHN